MQGVKQYSFRLLHVNNIPILFFDWFVFLSK